MRGVAGVELVGEDLEVLEVGIERVRGALVAVEGENRGLGFGRVGPGGLGLGRGGLSVGEDMCKGEGFELVGERWVCRWVGWSFRGGVADNDGEFREGGGWLESRWEEKMGAS